MKKMNLLLSFCLVFISVTGCSEENSSSTKSSSSKGFDLNGLWIGQGYRCWGNLNSDGSPILLDEDIKIDQDGSFVVATKITGDECIHAGEITWDGKINGSVIDGMVRGRRPSETEVVSDRVSIHIESNNRLKLVIPAQEMLFGLITLSPSDSLVFIRRNGN